MNIPFGQLASFGIPVILCMAPSPVCGQAGALDPSFDGDGMVTTVLGDGSYGSCIAVQSDGKIVVGGSTAFNLLTPQFFAARYNPDGTLDNTFNGYQPGIATTPIGDESDRASSIVLQPDGKIVLGGFTDDVGTSSRFCVLRYNSGGSLDNSFSGDGIATTALGTSEDVGRSLVLQPDGKLLLGGYSDQPGSGYDFAVVRYMPNGNLDPSFSGDGKVTTELWTNLDIGSALALQPDGRILLGGSRGSGTNKDFAMVRYLANGTLDSTFGGDGMMTSAISSGADEATSMALQPDGKILLAGTSQNHFAIARYLPEGSLDSTFGINGITTFPVGSTDLCLGIALRTDGKILLTGRTGQASALVRLTPDGLLDLAFDGDGIVTTYVGLSGNGLAVTSDADSRTLVSGLGNGHIVVLRYLDDLNVGVLDYNGGTNTTLVYPNPVDDQAAFEFELPTAAALTCSLKDADGRTARTFFVNTPHMPGMHREVLTLTGLASGHYTLVLSEGDRRVSVRVVKQ